MIPTVLKFVSLQDLLFDQYFYQVKEVTDFNSPRIINFEREIYFSNFVEEIIDGFENDLHFYLNPVHGITTITNRESHSKVIINALNTLSFWFNFCVLDAHVFIRKFFGLFLKLYQVLLVLKGKLNSSCKAPAFQQFLNTIQSLLFVKII